MTSALSIAEQAERLDVPFQEEIDDAQVDTGLLHRLPLTFARNRRILPLSVTDGRLLVAMGNPTDLQALDEIQGVYGLVPQAVAVPPDKVLDAVNRHYTKLVGTAQDVVEELEGVDLSTIATELLQPRDLLELAEEAPVIRLLNSILFQAVKERASDIHIEPFERELEVRFRIDGILYRMLSPPRVVQEALASRIKVMAGLDIAEKRLPQDGRIRVIVAGRDVDIRVSIVPTCFGERTVLRLLDRQKGEISLSGLGLSDAAVQATQRLLKRTSGIILVTGPTGSGKSTTLYAALNYLNSPEKNIITIEDPVEYQLKGIGQIQVNPKINLTFANGLRSILRQDPDVIMVGEIRDAETAEIAMQASLTGHLVLTTLHTNNSASAVTRLMDMGIEPFMVASSLSAVVAQRLVRKICPNCRESYRPDREYQGLALPELLYRGRGCEECFGIGMSGRLGIYEFLPVDAEICSMIVKSRSAGEIKEAAIARGMKTLRDDGMEKVAAGLTTIEELLRVTQDEYADLSL